MLKSDNPMVEYYAPTVAGYNYLHTFPTISSHRKMLVRYQAEHDILGHMRHPPRVCFAAVIKRNSAPTTGLPHRAAMQENH